MVILVSVVGSMLIMGMLVIVLVLELVMIRV